MSRRDLEAHDALDSRITRLSNLLEKAQHAQVALGSDVIAGALEGYAFLQNAGKHEGLAGLRAELRQRT